MTDTTLAAQIEALAPDKCGAVSEDALRHLAIRDQLNRTIYKAVRAYRMSNMVDADDPSWAYPLVDLMSNPAPADIGTGEMEMIALVDEIAEEVRVSFRAIVTPPRQAEKRPAAEIVAQDRGDWQTVSLQAEIDKGVGVEQWIAQNKPPQAEAAPGVVEAAARIIDPNAWGDLGHDSYLQRADEWFAKGRPEDDVLVGGYRQKAADMVKPSLAKAASVLALARQHGAREGMVLVPPEPTEAMVSAGLAEWLGDGTSALTPKWREYITKTYSAMIAAAPATDVGEGK